MNRQAADDGDSNLSAVLRCWQVSARPPVGFAEGVWKRLEAKGSLSQASIRSLLRDWLLLRLRRPRFALAYMTAVLVLGAGAGALRGHAMAQGLAHHLQGRYVQSIDPYATTLR